MHKLGMIDMKVQERFETRFPVSGQAFPALRLCDVHGGYGRKEILHGVDLVVQPGEIVALLGDNGSGKSTLLRTAAGLLQPSQGTILLAGKDVTRWPAFRRAHQKVGYLPQTRNVFSGHSVRENLRLATLCMHRERRMGAAEVVEWTAEHFPSLIPLLGRRAGLLSGGQRQLLAVAMVIARHPALLLLDELCAGLTPLLAQELLALLAKLTLAEGTAVLLVEQLQREAAEIATSVVWISAGQISSYPGIPASASACSGLLA